MTANTSFKDRWIVEQKECDELAALLLQEPLVGMDLEFVSDDRFQPALALMQISFERDGESICCAVDPLEVDVSPLAEVCNSPSVRVILHGGKQDLQILQHDFGIQPKNIFDLQIAAAFCGIADQIGYANLVERLLKRQVDKDSQHTNWLKRPLTDKQKSYALGDVEFLIPLCKMLEERLGRKQKWFETETQLQAELAVKKKPPSDAYLKCKGWHQLTKKRLGLLANLAEWREHTALSKNKPLSWIVSDMALMDLVKKRPTSLNEMKRFRSFKKGQIEEHGEELLSVLDKTPSVGPFAPNNKNEPLNDWQTGQIYGALAQLYFAACKESMSPKLLGSRKDVETLIRLKDRKTSGAKLVSDWRFEVVGQKLLAWLDEHPEP